MCSCSRRPGRPCENIDGSGGFFGGVKRVTPLCYSAELCEQKPDKWHLCWVSSARSLMVGARMDGTLWDKSASDLCFRKAWEKDAPLWQFIHLNKNALRFTFDRRDDISDARVWNPHKNISQQHCSEFFCKNNQLLQRAAVSSQLSWE